MSRSSDSRSRPGREGDVLTDRELQILALVAAGETTAAIGGRLGISENTVKSHLTRVYLKTGSRNRVQAARYYLDNYTIAPGRDAPAASPLISRSPQDEVSVIERQAREIQARIDQLTPAASELERLQHALAALRAVESP
jgi:DNA-binding CsgD family transcriptional regulator